MSSAPPPSDRTGADVLAGYRTPSQLVQDKVVDVLDRHCRAFIGLSPFATLATASADGHPEISPRGGDPGFARVLDEHRLALPDRQGNNRVDSLRAAVGNPRAALLFFVPGFEETLKVFGTTSLLRPDELDLDLTEFGRPPRAVLVVHVERAYFQCGKAVMRSGLWDPAAQVDRSVFPSLGEVLRDHCRLDTPLPGPEQMRAELEQEL